MFEHTGHHGQYIEHKDSFSSLWRNLLSQQPGCSTNALLTPIMNVGNVCLLSNIVLLEYRVVISQNTHSDEVWALNKFCIKCYHGQ